MFFEIHRLGIFTPRSLDIDVVYDVMIHDLDILLSLVDSHVVDLKAVGIPVITDKVDIAQARIEFATGTVANLTASRVSTERVRKMRFFQAHEYISLDFTRQDALRVRVQPAAGRPRMPGIGFEKLPADAGRASARRSACVSRLRSHAQTRRSGRFGRPARPCLGRSGNGRHPRSRTARPSGCLYSTGSLMIRRTLVPVDVRPVSKDEAKNNVPHRVTTYMDDRTVVPSGPSDAPPLDGKTTIPAHMPLDVLVNRTLVARGMDIKPLEKLQRKASAVSLEILDSRTVVPAQINPLTAEDIREFERPVEMTSELREMVKPDIFTTGDANLLIEPEEKADAKWDAVTRVLSILVHIGLIAFLIFIPKLFPASHARGNRPEPAADKLDLFTAVNPGARASDSEGQGRSQNAEKNRSARSASPRLRSRRLARRSRPPAELAGSADAQGSRGSDSRARATDSATAFTPGTGAADNAASPQSSEPAIAAGLPR